MAVEKVELTCITCPMGCQLTATVEDGTVTYVTGNTCPRGAQYAREELTTPMRMLTGTVKCKRGRLPLLPVVSAAKLPKTGIIAAAAALRSVKVTAPVKAGDVIVKNIMGFGVDIVAARDMQMA